MVWYMTMTIQDNNMIDHVGAVYAEIKSKLSWSIEQDVVCHEKQIRHLCDRSYKCDLRKIQYWTMKTDQIVYGLWWKWDRTSMWLIIQVCSTSKMKLNFKDNPIRHNLWWRPYTKTTWLVIQVRSTLKIELNYHDRSKRLWYIIKIRQDNDVINRTNMISAEFHIELSRLVRPSAIYEENETRE